MTFFFGWVRGLLMTTSNAAADAPAKGGADKVHDKLAEKRRALGRGLESLLPGPRVVATDPTLPQIARKDGAQLVNDAAAAADVLPATAGSVDVLQAAASDQADTGEHAFELGLDQIDENPYQTRKEFDPKALTDLAGSIQSQGVLQPIVVRPRSFHPALPPPGPPRFLLILGERRFRASKIAGRTTIPAIVKRVSEQQAAEMTLVENLQRQDLDCLEQAQAFANLSTDFNMTQEEIGKRVGVSREQVSNYLRLLKLPPTVLIALRKRELTYSHARLLLSLNDDKQIIKVAEVAIAKKMSVALLTDMVMNLDLPKKPLEERQSGGARWVDPNVRAAQRTLELVLGMRVRIRDRKGKGKITIEYGTLEDFDLLVRMLRGQPARKGE
jgi:ParB family transcriptional regulator, chromosome partitioning protein